MTWTSTLSLQLIAVVQKFSNGDIWKFANDTALPWEVIFQQTSWPSSFRPEDLIERWNDIIKQFKEENSAKRANEVRFEDLARFLSGQGNKRKEPSSEASNVDLCKVPRSENVASWRVLLEQTCPFPHWYVTTHQGQVLEPKLLLRLANGKADLQEEEVHHLARALSRFPILTHIEEVIPLLETKSAFFYVVTSTESTELAFIDAVQRCFIWRIAPTAAFHFPQLPELISQLPQAAVRTHLSSSLIERRIMFLYVISKASLAPEGDIFSTWTDVKEASLSIFADLVQQGLCLKMRPSLPLTSKYLLDALTLLNINVPEWLQYMGRSIPDSEESRRHIAQCLLEQLNIATQLVVIQLGNTVEVSLTWADQSHPLCLVAMSKDQAYAPVLRIGKQSNGSVQVAFPFPDAIYELKVNTRSIAVSKSLSMDMFQKLNFIIEGKKISIANQEQHLLGCTSKQQMANETEKCLVLSKIDTLLESNCLRRNSVQEGGYCLLRAVLLAQGKEDTHAEIVLLLNSIWNRAKEKQFTSNGLTNAQRQELLVIKDPVQLYSRMSSSSSAFECFWNMPYHWIAQVLSKDLYLISSPLSETCTRYSKDPNVAPSIISLSELAQLLHSNVAIALIHIRLPPHTLHIEWLSSTLTTKQLELLEEIFTENDVPSVPQHPQRENTAVVPLLSPQMQLETLLSGGSLNISTSTKKDHWWSAWESVYQKFRTCTGSIVRYSRQKENPNIWRQYPTDTTLHTLELWYKWHETAKQLPIEELQDLYYLIDVEVEEKDLNDLIKEIPVMGLLDDRTSPYSLHTYLRKVCPNLHFPDLRPRLYFAPGIIPGAISTPLHLDGFGHMTSYHWYLGFEKGSSNLVDIYPSEEEMGDQKWKQLCHTVGAALSEAGYELPHAVYHDSIATMRHGCDEYEKLVALGIVPTRSIELKAGEILILPAGQPHAFKKWSTTTTTTSPGPLVSLAGDIAWIGSTQKETLQALTRMMKVEELLKESYCLPELSMMASLMCGDQDRSTLFKEHISVFLPYLREILSQELDAFARVSLTETATRSNDPSIWLCSSCEKVIINTVIWCRVADEAYCLECYPSLSLKRRGESKRARGLEDFTASFRFSHPAELMKKLMELESVIHPSTPKKLSPSLPPRSIDEVIVEISEAIRLQKIDTDHRICKLGLDVEKSCDALPKHTQEVILLLNRDIPFFCHSEAVNVDECPLLATTSEREHRYEADFRRRFRCVICHTIGSWNRPLLSCIESTHHQNPPFFHQDCASYRDKKVPSGAKLFCPTCVRDKRNDRSAIEFRNLHVWESIIAEVELYQQGYRVIQIPKDGLCFLTVLYMMIESTTVVPEAKAILEWAIGIPHLLLLEKSANAEENTPLKSVASEVKKWSSRSLDEWKSHWDTEGFDGVCTALPKLLEDAGILGSNFHRYMYRKETMKGSWFNSSGSPVSSSVDVNFAVLYTETPIPHYSLVERHSKNTLSREDLDRISEGGLLNCNVIGAYFTMILSPKHPNCYYLDPAFYTKLSNQGNVKELYRWFKKDLGELEKIFIPIYHPGHWCLAVVDLKGCQIEYYDSLSKVSQDAERVRKVIGNFLLGLFLQQSFNAASLPTEWPTLQPSSRPLQDNVVDCGVFVCSYALCRSTFPFNSFNFTTKDIPHIRREIKNALEME